MITFIFKRILYAIPVLLGVAAITLVLFNVAGGDPVAMKLGKNPDLVEVELLRQEMGLTGSFVSQYFFFLRQCLTFDFGTSWSDNTPVREVFWRGIVPTLTLSVPAFGLSSLIAIVLSLVVAWFRGSMLDRTVTAMTMAAISVSSLVYILLGQWLLADKLKWFPIWGYDGGLRSINFVALPICIWVLMSVGTDVRYFRTVVLEEVGQDYVRTARAKGLSPSRVLFFHVLPNSMLPIITRLTIAIPFLITGAFLMEVFFGIPGLGSTLFTAISNSDLPIVKAFTMLGATLYVIFNILADVLYAVFDPRVGLD